MAMKTRKTKKTAEQIQREERRVRELEVIQEAIREGRAYLDTAWGKRKVVGYRDDTGDCYTNNTGRESDSRTFLICLDSIKIERVNE